MARKRIVSVLSILTLVAVAVAGCTSSGNSGDSAQVGLTQAEAGYAVDSVAEPPGQEEWRNASIDPEEEYDDSPETPFKQVATSPLSTFSADVDTASYSNTRRMINDGLTPEGVRIEELINYFSYDYPAPDPDSDQPFSVTTEEIPCPWNEANRLAVIGIQGAATPRTAMPNNLVFLVDVSGSMEDANKLPLLRDSLSLLIEQLDEDDTVSLVTYAGSSEILADSIPGNQRDQLRRAIERLTSGGSTNGEGGLRTAYDLARKNFNPDGNNRVILATDGDFNVGQSSEAAMKDLIETERASGIYISVLGFGMGNLKDVTMETIADNGNGNYAYIDTLAEAEKVLVHEFDSTMLVIAQDLKLQVEFNPATVAEYRLIGYNNRRLENEDFNDDTKDAGDIGAGHSVTALYEIVPAGAGSGAVAPLKYQETAPSTGSADFMTVKIRYKKPGQTQSVASDYPVGPQASTDRPSVDADFATAVAEFGLILTGSRFAANSSLADVESRAASALGQDEYGLRSEFCDLVARYRTLVA